MKRKMLIEDKRQFVRVKVKVCVRYKAITDDEEVDTNEFIRTTTKNICTGGLGLYTTSQFEIDDILECEIELPSRTIKAKVNVRNSQKRPHENPRDFLTNLSFIDIDKTDQIELNNFIDFELKKLIDTKFNHPKKGK